MHAYRSHTCAALTRANVGETIRLSGWVHRRRDHGGVIFIDLRDHFGITQVLCDPDSPVFAEVEKLRAEYCIRIDGEVKARDPELVNPKLPTGEIEVFIRDMEVLGASTATAAAGLRRSGIPRGNAPEVPLPRPAAREDAGEHDAALRRRGLDPAADVGQRASANTRRRSSPPPAPRARATSSCPRACIPASSTRCRRRRSSSSSS
jgi:hypothetical protein